LLDHERALASVGRLVQAQMVLSWALVVFYGNISALGALYIVLVIACGARRFLGFFVIQATLIL